MKSIMGVAMEVGWLVLLAEKRKITDDSSEFVVHSSQLEPAASFLLGSMKSEDPAFGGVSG